jgi:hypothetical protein
VERQRGSLALVFDELGAERRKRLAVIAVDG